MDQVRAQELVDGFQRAVLEWERATHAYAREPLDRGHMDACTAELREARWALLDSLAGTPTG